MWILMLELKISTAPSPYFLFIYLFFDKVRVIFVDKVRVFLLCHSIIS